MTILRKVWFWVLAIGLIVGFYLGYQVGIIRGYERAISTIHEVVK